MTRRSYRHDIEGLAIPSPVLKWVGGKWVVAEQMERLLPKAETLSEYREPYFGGGGMFFRFFADVRPAILSDINWRLIDAYIALRDHVEELIDALAEEQTKYSPARYYEIRARLNLERQDRPRVLTLIERAVGVFVISKWGYNGVWRERRDGGINTPVGSPEKDGSGRRLFDPSHLRVTSAALQGAELYARRAAETIAGVRRGGLVYLDPPFAATFTGYSAEGFSYGPPTKAKPGILSDGSQLAEDLRKIHDAGAFFAVSNSDSAIARKTFRAWPSRKVTAARSVTCKASERTAVTELVFRNYRRTRAGVMEIYPAV